MDKNNITDEKYKFFFNNYGNEVPLQPPDDAKYDPQINSMSLSIVHVIGNSEKGTILDIGCGTGIILKRISEKTDFLKKDNGWRYLGVDDKEKEKGLLHLAVDLELIKSVDFLARDKFYKDWISSDCTRPLLIIIRNVFHELDIKQTVKLVYALMSRLEETDTLIIQDLQVFPEAERGNACWQPKYFIAVLERCGFKAINDEQTTPRGNQWFTLIANRNRTSPIKYEEVKKVIIQQREKQLEEWKEIETQLKKDLGSKDENLALARLDVQRLSIIDQLKAIKKEEQDNKEKKDGDDPEPKDTAPKETQVKKIIGDIEEILPILNNYSPSDTGNNVPIATTDFSLMDKRINTISNCTKKTYELSRGDVNHAINLFRDWMLNGTIVRLIGVGRAKLAGSIAANRLAHGGARVYIQDDLIPMPHSITGGGIIAVSASGGTPSVLKILSDIEERGKSITVVGIADKNAKQVGKYKEFKRYCKYFIGIDYDNAEVDKQLSALADIKEHIISLLLDAMVVAAGRLIGYDDIKWGLGHEDLGQTGPYDPLNKYNRPEFGHV